MPIGISFQSTQDNYTDACTLGPSDQLRELSFIVANNSVKYQLAKLDPAGNPYWDAGELATSPTVGGFQDVYGIRFRSYTPGIAAVIVAEGFFNDDPSPVGGTPFTATLTGSGGQTPGQASVEIDHNGTIIGTEPKINFVDADANKFTVTDDNVNQRVSIDLPKVITGHISAAGGITAGNGFTITKGVTGIYTVHYVSAFAVPPMVLGSSDSAGDNANITFTSAAGSCAVTVVSGSSGAPVDHGFFFFAFAIG